MIYTLELDFYIQPKPRGIKGKNGNIYHSSAPYKLFKSRMAEAIDEQLTKPDKPMGGEFFTGFFYGYRDFGQNPDIDNLEGAVLDSLKTNEIIYDDNRRYWTGSYKLDHALDKHQSLFYIGTMLDRKYIIDQIDRAYSKHFRRR